MARFVGGLPTDVIKMFETLEKDTQKIFGEMVVAGAEVVKGNVEAKMPPTLRAGLISSGDSIRLTRVYITPSDDGINCQVMIDGYFTNRNGKVTPAPLVANMFEYGSSSREYPKTPFFRSSFNKGEITKAMLKVQDKYIKEG